MRHLHAVAFSVALPLSMMACSGTARVTVSGATGEALALSADEAAGAVAADPGASPTADAFVLHVLRTEVHVAGADEAATRGRDGDAEEAQDADDNRGWVEVSGPRDVDLVPLGDTAADIAGGDVPAGTLTQVRLVLDVDDPAVLVVDDAASPVSIPSGAETGLKLLLAPPLDLSADGDATLSIELGGTIETALGALSFRPTLRLLGVERGADAVDAAADADDAAGE